MSGAPKYTRWSAERSSIQVHPEINSDGRYVYLLDPDSFNKSIPFTLELYSPSENDFNPQNSTIVTFPASSVVGNLQCQQYTVIGDDVKEGDEMFIVSVSQLNSIDIIEGPNQATVTIRGDGDGKCKT